MAEESGRHKALLTHCSFCRFTSSGFPLTPIVTPISWPLNSHHRGLHERKIIVVGSVNRTKVELVGHAPKLIPFEVGP